MQPLMFILVFLKEVWLKKEKPFVFLLESCKCSPRWTLHTVFGFSTPGSVWEALFF